MTASFTPFSSTLFLSPDDVATLVRGQGMRATLQGLADCIRQDFLRWNGFEKTARLASHSRDGVIELMPIADASTFSFKYVNGHPKNTALGLPTVMAFGVLADVATGWPLLVSELTLTTALRTAATSVVAAQALARPGSRTMALIGNGAQSEFQALAFHLLLGIEEIRLYDTDAQASAKLLRNLQANPDTTGLRVRLCTSISDFAVTELWQVLAGEKAGRDSPSQVTMFDSVGFALEDFSALRYLRESAARLNLGRPLPLIAQLEDPKNLYQLVGPAPISAAIQPTALVKAQPATV